MKYCKLIVVLSILTLSSCIQNKKGNDSIASSDLGINIPESVVNITELKHNKNTSVWKHNNQLYSGYATEYNQDSILIKKTGFFNGKKEGEENKWYLDGHLKQVANYKNGKLHGMKKVWSLEENHVLISQLNYNTGKPHGEQLKWYKTGELFKKMNLNMGKEDGIQQAYRKNGDLYANYEARNGRVFGLKKSSLCYGVEDGEMDN